MFLEKSMKAPIYIALSVLLWSGVPCVAADDGKVIVGATVSNGQIQLLCLTTNAWAYQVQSNAWIQTRYWQDVGPALVSTGGTKTASASADGNAAFFRVLEFTNAVLWYDWAYYYQQPTLSAWGLGSTQDCYTHMDRANEWYIDQADTGVCSNNNCGPSSVTMAIKWHDSSFTNTAEDARNIYWEGRGWWYTYNIIDYLNLRSIPNTTSGFTGTNQLMQILSASNIVILCINTAYLTRNYGAEQRVGRFYDYAGGHFLVVKGWRSVSGNVFFETYDPNNWHSAYGDNSPKGRNRHFSADDLNMAIANWWNYLIVIPASAGGGGQKMASFIQPVDPKTIVHMPGR